MMPYLLVGRVVLSIARVEMKVSVLPRDLMSHGAFKGMCERASCYARANLPRTVPKSYWSWPVAICEESVPTCTVVSSNTVGVHVPQRLYACPMKTEVPD